MLLRPEKLFTHLQQGLKPLYIVSGDDPLLTMEAADAIRARAKQEDYLEREVLAVETNKAINALPIDYDWAFYIQADELLHEKYHYSVAAAMNKWKDDKSVDGLLFKYLHFYGSFDYTGDSTKWYRNEIRIIRPEKSIRSFRDAQGFKKNGNLLNVRETDATIYHYGWVKPPSKQQEKQKYFHSLWHSDGWLKKNVSSGNEFDYSAIDSLSRFSGTHPSVMQDRISKYNWKFDYDRRV